MEGGAHPEDEADARSGTSIAYLLQQRKVWGLALGWGGYNYTFFLLLTWLPTYLSISLHVDLLHSVLYTSVPWLVATATDVLVGGWLVDALIARGFDEHRVRQIVLLTGTSLGLGIIGTATAHTVAGALFWISVSTGGLSAAAPVAWTIPSLDCPTRQHCHHCRHHQLQQPGLRSCGTYHHWLYRGGNAYLCISLCNGGTRNSRGD